MGKVAGLTKRVLGVLALSCGLASPGWAQVIEIPPETIRNAGQLTPAQEKDVRDYIGQFGPMLGSETPAERSQARQALRRPLTDTQITVSFRLVYGAHLSPVLREWVRSAKPEAIGAALMLSGELATYDAAQIAVGELAGADPVARYQAAFALGMTFRTLVRFAPAMTAENATALANAAGQRIAFSSGTTSESMDRYAAGAKAGPEEIDPAREETDPWVLDRLVRTLGAASELGLGDAKYLDARAAALRQLASKMAVRIRTEPALKGDAATRQVLTRAAEVLQSAFSQRVAPPDDIARLAAAYGWDCLNFASAALASERDETTRASLIQLATLGENITVFARGTLAPTQRIENFRAAEALATGAGFADRLRQVRDALVRDARLNEARLR